MTSSTTTDTNWDTVVPLRVTIHKDDLAAWHKNHDWAELRKAAHFDSYLFDEEVGRDYVTIAVTKVPVTLT